MIEKFKNDWTREIEKLRKDKAALLEACKVAAGIFEMATDDHPESRSAFVATRNKLLAAIAQAEKEG